MRNLLSKLWSDDSGFLVSMEMLFTAVILVLGLIAGWAVLRAALVVEYAELAVAIAGLNEGYVISSVATTTGGSASSVVVDATNVTTGIQGGNLIGGANTIQLGSNAAAGALDATIQNINTTAIITGKIFP